MKNKTFIRKSVIPTNDDTIIFQTIEINYHNYNYNYIPHVYLLLVVFYCFLIPFSNNDIMRDINKAELVSDIVRYNNSSNKLILLIYCNELIGFMLYQVHDVKNINIIHVKTLALKNNNDIIVEKCMLQYFHENYEEAAYIIIENEPHVTGVTRSFTKSYLTAIGCTNVQNKKKELE